MPAKVEPSFTVGFSFVDYGIEGRWRVMRLEEPNQVIAQRSTHGIMHKQRNLAQIWGNNRQNSLRSCANPSAFAFAGRGPHLFAVFVIIHRFF